MIFYTSYKFKNVIYIIILSLLLPEESMNWEVTVGLVVLNIYHFHNIPVVVIEQLSSSSTKPTNSDYNRQ